jgi:hypothetical protein
MLDGMRRRQAVATRVKDAACQERLGLLPGLGIIGPLPVKLSLNRLKQRAIEDGGLLARKDLALVPDLTNIEAVAQEGGERSPGERDAGCSSIGKRTEFGLNAGPP